MDRQYVIGIDIGGTNTVIGLIGRDGKILCSDSIKTQKQAEFTSFTSEIYNTVMQMINDAGIKISHIQGIGIGAPNANRNSGNIDNAANLPWKGTLPLCSALHERFGLKVKCTNDANAAAIGEMTYGAARGIKNFIMITLGTGVGSSIVVDGKVVYGANGFAGELGHVIVKRENGRKCNCGRRGCLECYCSATGIVRTAKEFLEQSSDNSILRAKNLSALTSKDIYDTAMQGDHIAKYVFDYTGRILGEAFADFAAFTAPEAIVLFGGLANAGPLLLNPIKDAMDENTLYVYKGMTKIILSELDGTDAALLGAGALAWATE